MEERVKNVLLESLREGLALDITHFVDKKNYFHDNEASIYVIVVNLR